MRLFLCLLAAALVAILEGADTFLQLDKGLPDGTEILIEFQHFGQYIFYEPVRINFYDQPHPQGGDDINAHFRLERNWDYPFWVRVIPSTWKPAADRGGSGYNVYSNTYENGQWINEEIRLQVLDYAPLSGGHWKIDFVKIDKYHMNVFFNGYWSGMRSFERSLDDVRCIQVESDNVHMNTVKMLYKVPNGIVAPLSLSETLGFLLVDPVPYRIPYRFPKFPVGAWINMVAVMRASGEAKKNSPTLFFTPVDSPVSKYFVKIVQIWGGNGLIESLMKEALTEPFRKTHELHITTTDKLAMQNKDRWEGIQGEETSLCTDYDTKPNGDLVHIRVERISRNQIKMTVTDKGHSCRNTISEDNVKYLDQPFEIINYEGAFIVYLEHSIPM